MENTKYREESPSSAKEEQLKDKEPYTQRISPTY